MGDSDQNKLSISYITINLLSKFLSREQHLPCFTKQDVWKPRNKVTDDRYIRPIYIRCWGAWEVRLDRIRNDAFMIYPLIIQENATMKHRYEKFKYSN
jgi:hypothetical protein